MFKFTFIGALLLTVSGVAAAGSSDGAHNRKFNDWYVNKHETVSNYEHHQQTFVVGEPVAAPEIDPASAVGAMTLLFGGLVVLRNRKTAK